MNEELKGKTWAYVHGEISDAERTEMERALPSDPELRREVEEVRRMDRQMRALMPLTELTDEKLADEILARIDAAPARPARAETPSFLEWLGGWADRLLMPQPVLRLAMAAAAVLILVGGFNLMQGPVGWTQPEILVPSYRGAVTLPPGVTIHREDELRSCADELGGKIEEKYEAQAPRRGLKDRLFGRRDWRLRIRVQVLPTGKLHVAVSPAAPAPGAPGLEWTQVYADSAEFRKGIDELSARVAGELATQRSP